MTNHMDTLKLSTIKEIFPDELIYLQQHRWDFVERNFTYLSLLNNDLLSTWHLDQIRRMMVAEEQAKIEAEKEAQEKKRDPSQLSGGYVRQ